MSDNKIICIDSSDDEFEPSSKGPNEPNANKSNGQLHTNDGSASCCWQEGANNSCRLDGGGDIALAASRTFDETDDDSSVSSSDSILNMEPIFGKPSAPSQRLGDGLSSLKPEKHRKCKYFDLARAASSKRSAELTSIRKQAAYVPGILPPSVDGYLGTWQIRLLMDFREFGLRKKDKGKGFIDIAKKRIDAHFNEDVCEQMHLQVRRVPPSPERRHNDSVSMCHPSPQTTCSSQDWYPTQPRKSSMRQVNVDFGHCGCFA